MISYREAFGDLSLQFAKAQARIKELELDQTLLLSCYEETEALRRLVREMGDFLLGDASWLSPNVRSYSLTKLLNRPEVREIMEEKR